MYERLFVAKQTLNYHDLLREDHKGTPIVWMTAFVRKKNGLVFIQYRLNHDKTTYLSPRIVSSRLDDLSDDECRAVVKKAIEGAPKVAHSKDQLKQHQNQSGRIRLPSKPKQDKDTPAKDRHYFRREHEGINNQVAFAKAYSEKRRLRVQYKLLNDDTLYTAPSYLSNWMLGKDLLFANAEIKRWRNEHNQNVGTPDRLYPDFFKKHEFEFLRFLKTRAATADSYYGYLGKYVFPFFVGKLQESKIDRWSSHYVDFRNFLELSGLKPVTINKVYTGLRRYFDFLLWKGHYKVLYDPINETVKNQATAEVSLPGRLPNWDDLYRLISRMPPCKERWVIAIQCAFGLRISESLAADRYDIFGKESQYLLDNNPLIRQITKEFTNCFLFLSCKKAYKRDPSFQAVRKVIEIDEEPKSGPYIAVCIDKNFAKLMVQMIKNDEDLDEREDFGYGHVKKFLKEQMSLESNEFKFNLWTLHDFRRSSVTLKVISWGSKIGYVGAVHGHKSESTTKRYLQNAEIHQRLWSKGKDIEIND